MLVLLPLGLVTLVMKLGPCKNFMVQETPKWRTGRNRSHPKAPHSAEIGYQPGACSSASENPCRIESNPSANYKSAWHHPHPIRATNQVVGIIGYGWGSVIGRKLAR